MCSSITLALEARRLSMSQAPVEERWGIMQVAAHLSISYQTARNNMLAGDFGQSEYDAATRKLTVLASAVKAKKKTLAKEKK